MSSVFKSFYNLILALIVSSVFLNVQAREHHKAHKHGHGDLDISIEKNEIELDFELSAEDVIGFEHKPKNDQEKATIQEIKNKIETEFTGITVPEGCEVKKRGFDVDYKKGGHAEVEIEVDLKCKDVAKIKNLEVLIFQSFPKIKHVNVNIVTESAQKTADITPSNYKVNL